MQKHLPSAGHASLIFDN